ncbi:class I SAM-dependent methyltransferase [Haloferula sargassicola]|uniref:class I SAM-dependent methyltransferase n=1 Tax=Haloferula sargassicola TaxID=490096 RepID=UPI003365A567
MEPYIEAVDDWIKRHSAQSWTAVDLGCGDFQVGSRLFDRFDRYVAVDIVPSLIEAHRSNPAYQGVDFRCVDAIADSLPEGDVIFVRQVLQHLSNQEIAEILPKLKKFRYAIVSEHLPSEQTLRRKNLDKVHGGEIRLVKGSGVYLDAPPFSLEYCTAELLLEVSGFDRPVAGGVIRTTCYNFTP